MDLKRPRPKNLCVKENHLYINSHQENREEAKGQINLLTSEQKLLIDWVHPVYSVIHCYQQHPLLGASPDGMFLYSLVAKDALSVNFIDGSLLSLVPKLFAFSFSRICERNEERKQHKSVCIDWINFIVHTVHCLKKKEMTLSYIKNLSTNVLICGNLFLLW